MKKHGNNKGFTLVELIIVMAIMAILVGAIAPQVVKYVEKAREAKDVQVLSTVYTAVETVIASESSSATLADYSGSLDGWSLEDEVDKLLSTDMNTSDNIVKKCKSSIATKAGATAGTYANAVYIAYDADSGYIGVYLASAEIDVSAITVASTIESTIAATAVIGPASNQ